MARPDAFALQRSDLNPFLFAEVGTERSGMALTVVSVIARLGEDPWDEARRLSALPKSAAANCLAQIIAQMPASPWDPAEAAAIASRLIPLLPANSRISRPGVASPIRGLAGAGWVRAVLLYGALCGLLALNALVQNANVASRRTVTPAATHESHAVASPVMRADVPGATPNQYKSRRS